MNFLVQQMFDLVHNNMDNFSVFLKMCCGDLDIIISKLHHVVGSEVIPRLDFFRAAGALTSKCWPGT